ncbi:hypothetical protein B484DRAFT_455981 [Ochromonadaceae sp. CCMP2298]|nr:hypothetical protein B484DRAFT_455981 [Ochromonadaceae sp. CCMP2298]
MKVKPTSAKAVAKPAPSASLSSASDSVVAAAGAKRARAAPKEKRVRRFRSNPTSSIVDRIVRAGSQRLYLVKEGARTEGTEELLSRQYAVLGSTGNVYDVTIGRVPHCTCPDHDRGNLCKHILFCMLKVLRVPRRSPMVYQSALLQSELADIFSLGEGAEKSAVADAAVVQAYDRRVGGATTTNTTAATTAAATMDSDGPGPADDCPICFEPVKSQGEELCRCATCRKYVHKDCIEQWHSVAPTPCCCFCRAPWPTGSSAGEDEGDYINLSSSMPVSQLHTRDASEWTYRGYH